jgi:uncharacterized protein YmfQ (DUF2313 family)
MSVLPPGYVNEAPPASAGMMVSATLSLTMLMQPGGWALPRDPGSWWGMMISPMAAIWDAEQANMESLGAQVDPRKAVELLPAWQQMLGPDPCGRDLTATTLLQLQQLTYQRYTSRGGQSIPYFVGLAAAVGEAISIREGTWFRFGQKRFGVGCFSAAGNQFNWRVTLPQTLLIPRRFGARRFPDPFGSAQPSLSQCPITHACPAHTTVSFGHAAPSGPIGLETGLGAFALEDGSGDILVET